MSWDFSTDAEYEAKLKWAIDFVQREVYPLEAIADELDQESLDLLYAPLQEEVKAQGLWAAHLSPELGGQGYGQVKLGLLHEVLGRSHYAPTAFGCQAPDSGNAEILALAGSPEQKERWLFPLLEGSIKSAFSMTEPDTAGSDPTLLATSAVREGEGFLLNGRKWFTSHGSIADCLIVMAVTDPDAPPHRRASMFVLPADREGVEIVRDVPTMGHPSDSLGRFDGHAEVLYRDVNLDAAEMLGGEGDGFKIAQHRLGPGRIHHCMRWLGVASRALEMLCERSTYRVSGGSTLAKKQTVQNWIADSVAEMQAARLMTMHAAWRIDTVGAPAAREEIAAIKFYGAQVLHAVVDRAIQAHGALGYSCDLPLEAMYRHARAARIYDGPDEVHRASLARRVLRGVEAPAGEVPTEHLPTRRELARVRFAAEIEASSARAREARS